MIVREDIRVRSSEGGDFDVYLVMPDTKKKVPAIIVGCAVHGVDADLRGICDEFAEAGYIAAAPDLFWRTMPGPMKFGDERTRERSQPREEKIKIGEADMKDMSAFARTLPLSNGKVATIGLCYAAPYAVIGPQRLGYDAGISVQGSLMGPFAHEVYGTTQPISIMWGDQDHAAKPEVVAAYREAQAKQKNLEVRLFPGILHGYMNRHHPNAFNQQTYDLSMKRAKEILAGLSDDGAPALKRAS